ncbi:ChaN family lipoprotein [Massilia sp. YIM B04103]|uniref:ChaN family lipoprotein n=1 Tax=Massilia sp. YIM B04103 TaxID=2963106 RepID=UPI002109FF02|nr:ChaN family lipoprotein [Massilia sp. YIM B04103]
MKLSLSLAAILPACALALSACSSVAPVAPAATTLAQEVRQTGEIVDLRSGQRLNPEQLLARLAAAPRVIVGEEHDQLSHHRIQQWLLVQLQSQRAQGTVLLEMLNPDQQAKVDEVKPWLQSDPVVRSEHVAKLLAWQPSWKWELYGDLVMEAMRAPYPVWSANLDRSEIKQLFAAQPTLQGKHSNLANESKVRAQQEQIIREMHDNQIDAPRLAAMLSVQQQRDRRMAERLLAAPAPALLIAGGYHAAKDMGVPLHVQDLTGSAPPMVLMLAQRGAPITAQQADFVWFTPVAPAAAGTQ